MLDWRLLCTAAALVAAAGCFDEPRPAYDDEQVVRSQVYLKGRDLTRLSVDDVWHDGLVYLDCRIAGRRPDEEPGMKKQGPLERRSGGRYVRLSDQVDAFDPAALTYLNLDDNALTNVDEVVAFTGLKWLRLNRNRLTQVPDLSPLTQLRRLYLRDNDLAAVPEALRPDRLPMLDTVDLSGNPIAEIPDWLAARKGLEHLNFNKTHVTRLPSDLSNWTSLKSLQLSGVRLESLEELQRIRKALPQTRIVF